MGFEAEQWLKRGGETPASRRRAKPRQMHRLQRQGTKLIKVDREGKSSPCISGILDAPLLMRKDSKTSSFHLIIETDAAHASVYSIDLHWDNTDASTDASSLLAKPAWCHLVHNFLQLVQDGALEACVHAHCSAQNINPHLLAKADLDLNLKISAGNHVRQI